MDAAHPVPVPSAPASWRWSRLVPPEPLALQNPAYFDISQPPATQTSGSYYSTERATKRHFHNGTSHFASVLPTSPRARPNMWRVPDARPWPTTTGLSLLCECQLVTITCTVGVANAEKRYFLIITVEDRPTPTVGRMPTVGDLHAFLVYRYIFWSDTVGPSRGSDAG